jgi:peptide/nickel transport system ATP-binding protein
VKGELCTTQLPDLLPVDGAGAHTSRCHLHDKASIYEAEVAPRLG